MTETPPAMTEPPSPTMNQAQTPAPAVPQIGQPQAGTLQTDRALPPGADHLVMVGEK
jgi:hypothetical protein